jgi:hypothetical protein
MPGLDRSCEPARKWVTSSATTLPVLRQVSNTGVSLRYSLAERQLPLALFSELNHYVGDMAAICNRRKSRFAGFEQRIVPAGAIMSYARRSNEPWKSQ